MQLPGMSTDPVRVSIEVTWWPASNDWSLARRDWRRDHDDQWRLEGMSTTGTPLTRHQLLDRLQHAINVIEQEVLESDDPFSVTGAFR